MKKVSLDLKRKLQYYFKIQKINYEVVIKLDRQSRQLSSILSCAQLIFFRASSFQIYCTLIKIMDCLIIVFAEISFKVSHLLCSSVTFKKMLLGNNPISGPSLGPYSALLPRRLNFLIRLRGH